MSMWMNEMDSLMFLSVMYIVIFVYLWKFLAINISLKKKKKRNLYIYILSDYFVELLVC